MDNNTCLVWVRFGSFGKQLAHIHKVLEGGICIGAKWRDASRRWTGRVLWKVEDIKSYDIDLVDQVVQRAIRAATSGRPLCHHKHHLMPRVKAGYCGTSRQAVTA